MATQTCRQLRQCQHISFSPASVPRSTRRAAQATQRHVQRTFAQRSPIRAHLDTQNDTSAEDMRQLAYRLARNAESDLKTPPYPHLDSGYQTKDQATTLARQAGANAQIRSTLSDGQAPSMATAAGDIALFLEQTKARAGTEHRRTPELRAAATQGGQLVLNWLHQRKLETPTDVRWLAEDERLSPKARNIPTNLVHSLVADHKLGELWRFIELDVQQWEELEWEWTDEWTWTPELLAGLGRAFVYWEGKGHGGSGLEAFHAAMSSSTEPVSPLKRLVAEALEKRIGKGQDSRGVSSPAFWRKRLSSRVHRQADKEMQ